VTVAAILQKGGDQEPRRVTCASDGLLAEKRLARLAICSLRIRAGGPTGQRAARLRRRPLAGSPGGLLPS